MNGKHDFFSLMKVVQRTRPENSDLMEHMLFVIELLTTRTHYLKVVLIVISLTLFQSISRQNWNRELYSFIVSHLRRKAVYGESLCLLMPALSVTLLTSVNLVN